MERLTFQKLINRDRPDACMRSLYNSICTHVCMYESVCLGICMHIQVCVHTWSATTWTTTYRSTKVLACLLSASTIIIVYILAIRIALSVFFGWVEQISEIILWFRLLLLFFIFVVPSIVFPHQCMPHSVLIYHLQQADIGWDSALA